MASDARRVVSECRYVVLAVKPQGYEALLQNIAPVCGEKQVFVSIAAGMSARYIKSVLGENARLVLVMPNTPILVGKGATALSRVEPTSKEEFEFVRGLFAALGQVAEISPDRMNEIIPVNGSSPAFIYRFARIFIRRAAEMALIRNGASAFARVPFGRR